MNFRRAILILLIIAVEALLLSLAHWQYNRYHQRLSQIAERATLAPATLTGTPLTYAWLTNQPDPASLGLAQAPSHPGRRLIAVLQTATGPQIADLGWQPNPADPTAAPDFAAFPKAPLTLTGISLPIPPARGWLAGPVTTTHPQLLARLEPTALTSATMPATYFAATAVSPTITGLTPVPPPVKSPTTNISYALQWLAMAILFPIVCIALSRGSRKSRSKH